MRSPFLSRLLLTGSLLQGACAGAEDPDVGSGRDPAENADSSDEDEGDEGKDESDASPGTKDAGKLDAAIKDARVPTPAADAGDAGAGKVDASALDGGKTDASPGTKDAAQADDSLCHLAGNEIAILGDSYIDLSGDFTTMLQEHARKAGALGADDTYVDHALNGASMHGDPNIPAQFPAAVEDAKARGSKGIKAVIMTGGGNDVLIHQRSCLEKTSADEAAKDPVCVKVVDDVLLDAQKLYDDMTAHGVKAGIYFFYPHLPKDAPLGPLLKGSHPNSMLDYSYPRAKAFCDGQTKVPCYFIDMRPAFDDPKNPGWPRDNLISVDGVHPMATGSQILADEVWKVMQAKCIGAK